MVDIDEQHVMSSSESALQKLYDARVGEGKATHSSALGTNGPASNTVLKISTLIDLGY